MGRSLSAETKAKISAARRAKGRAFRAQAVDGNTLADLHARGVYRADAARIMGWSESVITHWEKDTGLRFKRMPQAERNRRQSEQVMATGAMERAKALIQLEIVAANTERMKALWADPERAAAMVAKRVASRKANPSAAQQSRDHLRSVEDKRLDAMREFFKGDAWAEARAKIAEKAKARFADPEERKAQGRRMKEARRKQRVQKGLAALNAGELGEKAARALIRDMTAEDRMIWMMQQDAAATRARQHAEAHRVAAE